MTIHDAFDGNVQFDCTPPNLKSLIVRDGLTRAVPESASFAPGSQPAAIFDNLVDFLARTRSVSVANDYDGVGREIGEFWNFAASSVDYRAIWERFIMLPVEIHNAWFDAIGATIDPRLLAPPEVQPGAPDDAVLEAVGGKKKSRLDKTTSQPLTPSHSA